MDTKPTPDANFMVPLPPKVVREPKIPKPTMWPCVQCGKLTRSHKFPKGLVMCHKCYLTLTDEEKKKYEEETDERA
jgi:hypothetical protein